MSLAAEDFVKFKVFKNFDNAQLEYLRINSKRVVVPAHKVLLKLAATHTNMFFLISGTLKLIANDGKEEIISDDSLRALNPIAHLRPSRYEVVSITEVDIIVVSEFTIEQARSMVENMESIDIQGTSAEEDVSTGYDSILFNILSQLHTGQLSLPSLPDIALKIRKVVENEESDAEDVAKIISLDQGIMAKVIMTANSAMYNVSGNKVDTIRAAYTRLGQKNVVNLVVSYTMKDLYKSESPLVLNKMKELWQHSVKVAAICSVLARLTPGMEADKALLAGLLHNVGSVVVINNLGAMLEQAEVIDNLDDILMKLQAEVGRNLLEKWEFPEEIIEVVSNAGKWLFDVDEKPSYTDIVNIAQLHAFIDTPYQEIFPNLDEIPAFHKLALGQLTPEMSLQVLEKSQAEIDETIALFSS